MQHRRPPTDEVVHTRQLQGERDHTDPVIAKEAEFLLDGDDSSVDGRTPELFFYRDLEGYAWCVRKGDYLFIGDAAGLAYAESGEGTRSMVPEVCTMKENGTAALLVVDIQNDFCAGGALPAPGGVEIIPAINRHVADATRRGIPVYATRDWHPPRTNHFKEYGGDWPPHCVQDTAGAEFHPGLKLPPDAIIVNKGDDPQRHGYSAFDGHTTAGKTLLDDLRERHISRVYVAGIATDYCVRESALDALRAGLEVRVLPDAIAGIDVRPGDAQRALDEISAAGARIVPSLEADCA